VAGYARVVDLDAFVSVHAQEWSRLDELSGRRRLNGAEVDELVTLYQRAATHLSVVRSSAPDVALANRLSTTVARARAAVTGTAEPFWRELARFALVSFPAAVWRARWWTAGAAAFTLAVAASFAVWVARSPRLQATFGSEEDIRQMVEVEFERYYSEYAATSFAARVWTNNAWISAVCIALGVTGIGVVYVLTQNALNLGGVAGLMAANGRLDLFFGLITPHGLLELTAVFVAAGAGLRLFWSWIDPGPRRRADAMAIEGRSMMTVALGLVVVLLVSGVVEAFVTPSGLSTWARIGIGVAVWLLFLGYAGVLGRRAAQTGETGDVRAELAGDLRPVAG
jgi:uncharacterized membrane protein SpoIIM required for sporulation